MGRLSFKRLGTLLLGILLIFGIASPPAEAAATEFDYDIYRLRDSLVLWIDISPAMTQQKLEDLLSGLDIFIGLDIKLERPRKLLFSKTLIQKKASVLLFHRLAEDTYGLRIYQDSAVERLFKNQIELSDFIADSLVFRICPLAAVENEGNPRMNLQIECKSLNPKIIHNRIGAGDSIPGADTSDSEFFEEIFSLFLDVIGFGQTVYKISSPDFDPYTLPAFDR